MTHTVRVLLFARLARDVPEPEFSVEVPSGAAVRDLAAQLQGELGLDLTGCVAAVNEVYASPDTPLASGDEVAFLPPVSGGSGDGSTGLAEVEPKGVGTAEAGPEEGQTQETADPAVCPESLVHVEVSDQPLSLGAAERFLVRARYGAQSYFVGTVRSPNRGQAVTLIQYEAYASMAVRILRAAAEEARDRFGGEDRDLSVYLAHRTGRLQPCEASIVIGVGSPHRRSALEAVDWLIEHVKATVPVWKLEALADGARWVEGVQPTEPL